MYKTLITVKTAGKMMKGELYTQVKTREAIMKQAKEILAMEHQRYYDFAVQDGNKWMLTFKGNVVASIEIEIPKDSESDLIETKTDYASYTTVTRAIVGTELVNRVKDVSISKVANALIWTKENGRIDAYYENI